MSPGTALTIHGVSASLTKRKFHSMEYAVMPPQSTYISITRHMKKVSKLIQVINRSGIIKALAKH